MADDAGSCRHAKDELSSLRQRVNELEATIADLTASGERLHRFETAAA